jgi:hypothetical protein
VSGDNWPSFMGGALGAVARTGTLAGACTVVVGATVARCTGLLADGAAGTLGAKNGVQVEKMGGAGGGGGGTVGRSGPSLGS